MNPTPAMPSQTPVTSWLATPVTSWLAANLRPAQNVRATRPAARRRMKTNAELIPLSRPHYRAAEVMGDQTLASITERKTRLDGSVVDYICEPLVVEPDRRAVVRYVTEQDRPLKGTDLVLRKGTVTVGHFWTDRPFNVYHWLDQGKTVALYVNIATDTTIDSATIAYRDLVVDVLIRPSG